MEDVYYETPRLPMFMLMEEATIARVRTLRFKNGKLDGVLADWDYDNLQTEFYGKEHWFDEFSVPFYCLYLRFGLLHIGLSNVMTILSWYYEGKELEDMYRQVEESAKVINCPIFDSEEEARKYVFSR